MNVFDFFDLTKWATDFIDWFSSWFLALLDKTLMFLFSWLPDASNFPTLVKPSEFQGNHEILTLWIQSVAWVLPVQFILGIISALSSFYVGSYVYRLILRFLRAME